jgi:TonB family protein
MLRFSVMERGVELPASYTPLVASILERPSPAASAPALGIAEPALEVKPFDIEMPQLSEIEQEPDAPESTALQFGQFIPPRPEEVGGETISQFERKASLKPGQMVRVILRVEVLPDGATGTVAIDTASGIPSADSAAVEYARSLRWVPASYGGEPTTMKVRLPVILTGAG